ncbi:MAG: Holliday junction resolvase RuvX [Anaerolineales bacterium]|jgi:putative Holliday junction resolvase
MRILAVDPGEKRIGLAISDPSGTIANPLTVIKHVSRGKDAAAITQIAFQYDAGRIVVGQALDLDGEPTFEGRRSARLAAAIRTKTDIPVELWDESGSTQTAQRARIKMGVPRKKRRGHLDELAATVILQSYLDSRTENTQEGDVS